MRDIARDGDLTVEFRVFLISKTTGCTLHCEYRRSIACLRSITVVL